MKNNNHSTRAQYKLKAQFTIIMTLELTQRQLPYLLDQRLYKGRSQIVASLPPIFSAIEAALK